MPFFGELKKFTIRWIALCSFRTTIDNQKNGLETQATVKVMAKGDGREVGFQDGGCFSRFLKRERISNYTFITFLNCG